jgi:hypothetical protein
MNSDERGSWYLLTGLVIGVVLGLLYAWVLAPVEYIDTAPAALQAPAKDRYRAAIAAAYAANGDVVRARARLELLRDPDPYRTLAEQAQRTLASGPNAAAEARALGALAAAIREPGAARPPTETAAPPTATATTLAPSVTPTTEPPATDFETPAPTRPPESITPPPPSPTPGGPFVLSSREIDCTEGLGEPLVRIRAQDGSGAPVAGIEVVLAWAGGEDRAFTGLQPELGLGYTDFNLTPEITYTLRLAPDGPPVTDLAALRCEPGNAAPFWAALVLTFTQR